MSAPHGSRVIAVERALKKMMKKGTDISVPHASYGNGQGTLHVDGVVPSFLARRFL